jgi:hypothetical protein
VNPNGWQRIGIVASVLWVIGAAIYVRSTQVQIATELNSIQINMCLPNNAIDTCLKLATEAFKDNLKISGGHLSNILFSAVAPVAAGWIFCYLFAKVFNWVLVGFRVGK